VIGILTTVIAIAIAAYKAIPPIFRHPDALIGQRLSLDKLDNIYPPLFRLGVVGPSMVGKTTLLKRILQQVPLYQRTLEVHAYVAVLQRSPILYLAMLDGPGQGFADQFNIASHADILCIILDHNASDHEKSINEDRIQEHLMFQQQLRWHLAKEARKPSKEARKPSSVHLLLNKRDLWEDSSVTQVDKERLKKILRDEEGRWKESNLARKVTCAEFSNHDPNNIADLLQHIYDLSRE
jgi:GTPase SAR1 family protein